MVFWWMLAMACKFSMVRDFAISGVQHSLAYQELMYMSVV